MIDTGIYKPVEGKTYSLFGSEENTDGFYSRISELTDELLKRFSFTEEQLLDFIIKVSRYRGRLKKATTSRPADPRLTILAQSAHAALSAYITGIKAHLKDAPPYKLITDKDLLTTREQYYLYMIEIELVNRLNREGFLQTNFRIALMPYCLRETQTDCKAEADEIDYQCKSCLKTCYINRLSKLLKENDIQPYIWRTARLRPLFRKLVKQHGSIGVMGVACVVELARGMRLCTKAGLPVIGIPLNANRCIRWMDGFYDTSIDLSAIEKLIQPAGN